MARDIIVYLRADSGESQVVYSNNKVIAATKDLPTAKYSEEPTIKIRPLKSDGSPYSMAELVYNSYEYGADTDKNLSTDPPIYTSSGVNSFVLEGVEIGSITYAQISFSLNLYTAEVLALFSQTETDKQLYSEFNAFVTGKDQPQLTWQFPLTIQPKILAVGTVTPPNNQESLYRTAAQQDAIDDLKQSKDVSQIISADTTLTNDNGYKEVFVTGAWEVTLFSAVGSTAKLRIINVGTGTVTITPDDTEEINGNNVSVTLDSQYDSMYLIAYNGNWIVPEHIIP